MTLRELRSHFPHTRETIYLNHAATGPLSRPVMSAVQTYLTQRHRTNIENYVDFAPIVESARTRAAQLIGADVGRVEFAPNTCTRSTCSLRAFRGKRGIGLPYQLASFRRTSILS